MSEPGWATRERLFKLPKLTFQGMAVKIDPSMPKGTIAMRQETWDGIEKLAYCSYIELEEVKNV